MSRSVVTIRLMVEYPAEQAEKLVEALGQVATGTAKNLKVFGMKTLGKEWTVGTPTKEEAVRLIPKRIHYGMGGMSLCEHETPKSRLSMDWKQVDCKRCRKKKPAIDPQLEMLR